MKIKGKSIIIGLLALVLFFNFGSVGFAEKNEVVNKRIYVNLEVGETFFDEETGLTITRLEDDHDALRDLGIKSRASNHLWDLDFNGRDFKRNFTLTKSMKWWKVAFKTNNNRTNIEVYDNRPGGKGTVYQLYGLNAGRYDAIKSDPAGTYTVQIWNTSTKLQGWAACRIGDSRRSVE